MNEYSGPSLPYKHCKQVLRARHPRGAPEGPRAPGPQSPKDSEPRSLGAPKPQGLGGPEPQRPKGALQKYMFQSLKLITKEYGAEN